MSHDTNMYWFGQVRYRGHVVSTHIEKNRLGSIDLGQKNITIIYAEMHFESLTLHKKIFIN